MTQTPETNEGTEVAAASSGVRLRLPRLLVGPDAPLVMLVLGSIALRAYVYAGVPSAPAPADISYPHSLRYHFFEYIWSNTLLPPLTYFLHAIPVFLLGTEKSAALGGFLLLTYVLDTIAVVLIYRSIVLLGASRGVALALSLLYSIALVPFEVWRSDFPVDHYDHHTIFFASFFAYSCIRVITSLDRRSAVLLGVASAMFILQSAIAMYLVPLTLVVVAVHALAAAHGEARRYGLIAIFVLTPLLVVAVLRFRDLAWRGTAGGGGRGGAAAMMFVQRALEHDSVKVRQTIIDAGAPQWYLWCYDHSKSPLPPEHPSYSTWVALARAFGTCSEWSAAPGVPGSPWPFRFDELIAVLEASGEKDLARVVELDRTDAIERQYLLVGFAPELASRWSGIYGAVSMRVARHLLLSAPATYLSSIRWHHRELFWGKGPTFFARTAGELKTAEFPLRKPLETFNLALFAPVARFAYVIGPLALLLLLVRRWFRRRASSREAGERLAGYLVLGVPTYAAALVFSGAVSVENDRYFAQVTPYLIVVAGCLARDARFAAGLLKSRIASARRNSPRGIQPVALGIAAASVLVIAVIVLARNRLDPPTCRNARWLDGSWRYRQVLTLKRDAAAEVLTDFPLPVQKTGADTSFWSHVASSGQDIRFTDCAGRPLAFELETFEPEYQQMVAWIRMPEIPEKDAAEFLLYYGNSEGTPVERQDPVWDGAYKLVLHGGGRTPTGAIRDSSQYVHRVKSTAPAEPGAGVLGSGFSFDGAETAVIVPYSPHWTFGAADWTVEFWVRVAASRGHDAGIVQHGPSGRFHVYYHRDGFWVLEQNDGSEVRDVSFTGTELKPDRWAYVVFARQGGHVRVAIDGVFKDQSVDVSGFAIRPDRDDLLIGRGWHGNLSGNLDEARISKGVARSPDWVMASYLGVTGQLLTHGAEESNRN